jgi:protein SDA1
LQVCPSLLIKKDRGRPINPTARPKAYGEVNVATDVPDAELLQIIDDDVEQESLNSDDSVCSGSDNDQESLNSDDENQLGSDDEVNDHDVASDNENDGSSDCETGADDVEDEEEDDLEDSEESDDEDGEISKDGDDDLDTYSHDGSLETTTTLKDSAKKRKFSDFNDQLTAADSSLRALKKLAGTTMEDAMLEAEDGILSNEDFQRIKELKVC